jgi:hypothetical protein
VDGYATVGQHDYAMILSDNVVFSTPHLTQLCTDYVQRTIKSVSRALPKKFCA